MKRRGFLAASLSTLAVPLVRPREEIVEAPVLVLDSPNPPLVSEGIDYDLTYTWNPTTACIHKGQLIVGDARGGICVLGPAAEYGQALIANPMPKATRDRIVLRRWSKS
jgi:hypothetical protein